MARASCLGHKAKEKTRSITSGTPTAHSVNKRSVNAAYINVSSFLSFTRTQLEIDDSLWNVKVPKFPTRSDVTLSSVWVLVLASAFGVWCWFWFWFWFWRLVLVLVLALVLVLVLGFDVCVGVWCWRWRLRLVLLLVLAFTDASISFQNLDKVKASHAQVLNQMDKLNEQLKEVRRGVLLLCRE